MSWHPASWRSRKADQQPSYPDPVALQTVLSCLRTAAPITTIAQARALERQLAAVAQGRAFLLQAGDCAETFAEFGPDKVRRSHETLVATARRIEERCGLSVIPLARMAGQFAKPRSCAVEEVEGQSLAVYRGDIVNSPEPDARAREADPMRMLEANRQSRATIDLMRSFAAAGEAGGSDLHQSARQLLSARASGPVPAPMPGAGEWACWTSHEALLLPYEESLLRRDSASGLWWSVGAHMLWVGDRTREADGAHVEFLRGLQNPIGIKCGPTLDAEALLQLCDRLDPENRPGRLALIGRFGAAEARNRLPDLMRATRRAGRQAIWMIDPMHGNTISLGGRKTRRVSDMIEEIEAFFDVAEAEGVHPGGLHLEMTGEEVTECVGGRSGLGEVDLVRNYRTHCDPRLNPSQALDLAEAAADRIRSALQPRSDAA